MTSTQTEFTATVIRLERAIKQFKGVRLINRILIGVVAALAVVLALAIGAILSNRRTVNDVKANSRDDLVRACQTLNAASRGTRESFERQVASFAKIIPPTPAGADALAELRTDVPANNDNDCNADGTLDAADYPA